MNNELVDKLAVLLEAFEEAAWEVGINATHAGAKNEDVVSHLQNMVKDVGVRVHKWNADLDEAEDAALSLLAGMKQRKPDDTN